MKLLYTPIKGYVHTVEAVIQYAGLRDQVEPVATRPYEADTPLPTINPLGTVPTLVLDSGEYLAGGPVIYEYLDSLHRRRRLFPAKGAQRWTTLRQAWMADGLFDTSVALVVEGWVAPAQQRDDYVARGWAKIVAVLDQIERDVPGYQRLDIGQMRTIGALQFLRLKLPLIGKAVRGVDPMYDALAGRPRLAQWLKPMLRKKLFREPLLKPE